MFIIKFARLVEIQTKAASMIPFIIGTLFAVYYFETFHLLSFVFMFISLLCVDMATTAINNFYDYKKARKKTGYGYETHNAVVKYQMKEWHVLGIIVLLLGIATAAGLLLVWQTDYVVLVLGMISFGIGILYSFGPIPISRLPLGEIFSGLFMGILIIFISVYIHTMDAPLIEALYDQGFLRLGFDLAGIVTIFLISIPAIFGIANIMLANNICDMEEDLANGRYTLPVFIGKSKALLLFRLQYIVSYVDVIALYFLGVHPVGLVLILLTYIPIHRNINKFTARPVKAETFGLAVKNFLLTCGFRVIVLGASIIVTVLV